MHVILSFFYINHVCSPDGGNKDIYIYIVYCWYHYYIETTAFPRNNDISFTSIVPLDCDNGVHVEFRKHLIFVALWIFQTFEK